MPAPLNVSRCTEADRMDPKAEPPKVAIRPLHDNVLLKRTKEERVRPSGLIVPDQASERVWSDEAIVVAVGAGRWCSKAGRRIPLDLERGQRVIFDRFAGQDVQIDGELYAMVPYDKIRTTEERT